MQYIRFLTTACILALVSACAPTPASSPTTVDPTKVPTATLAPAATPTPMSVTAKIVQPTPKPTETPTAPTKIAATSTISLLHPIPTNFPLATFTITASDGRYTVSFKPDGTFETTLKGSVAVKGTFDVVEDRLTFHDISGSRSCKAAQGDGTYKWAFDGTLLKLEGVADSCGARAGVLSGSVLTIER